MVSSRNKSICWSTFIVGLVVATLGVMALRAELAVLGLIVASTAGLVLLKIRAEALGRLETPNRMMAGTVR